MDSEPDGSATMAPGRVSLSVLIPNHNYGRYLGAAIESVLASHRPADELIVVDDGSTDDSVVVARRYDDVTLLEQHNAGQVSAILAGVERARGDVVVLLDSDDCVHPDRLAWIEAAFGDPHVVMAWHALSIDDGSGKGRGSVPSGPLPSGRLQDDVIAGDIESFPVTSGLAVRRSTLAELGPVPDQLRNAFDSFLVRAVPFHGKVASTAALLGSYRVHNRSSSRRADGQGEIAVLLDRRLDMATCERQLVADLESGVSEPGGRRAVGPPADSTFADLSLCRTRIGSSSRREYWATVRRLDLLSGRSSTSLWFPIAVAFYGLLPTSCVSALVEVKLTTSQPTGVKRVVAMVYWKTVWARLALRDAARHIA